MGANRQNKYRKSRRFAMRYDLVDDPVYRRLLRRYYASKIFLRIESFDNKKVYINHCKIIKEIKEYLESIGKLN